MFARTASLWFLTSLCLTAFLAAQEPDPTKAIGLHPKALPKSVITPLGGDVEHNAAIFVGVNEFTLDKGIRSLRYAVNDAVAQAHLFVLELKLVPPENCWLALSGKPQGADAEQLMADLEKVHVRTMRADRNVLMQAVLEARAVARQPGDMLIASFSTHGFSSGSDSYVMPADGLRGLLKMSACAYRDIEENLHPSKAGKILLLLDACREQPSTDDSKGGVDGAMNKAFLRALKQAEGKFVLASCGEGQFSYENSDFAHGVFTHFLLEGLHGQALADQNGFITLGAVSKYVSDSVEDWVSRNRPDAGGPAQRPWYTGDGTAPSIPLAIDPGVRAQADAFKNRVLKVRRDLTTKIDAAFTGQLYDKVSERLAKVQFDDPGKKLLENLESFINGSMGEEPFMAYIRDVLANRMATGDLPGPSRSVSPAPAPSTPNTPSPAPDSPQALLTRAGAGDADAMLKLADMYSKGVGVPVDARKALEFYRKAADAGLVPAMTELGRRAMQDYSSGIDYAVAFQWLSKSAEGGDGKGMFYLASLFETGRGTPQSDENANSWYSKAEAPLRDLVKVGDADAMYCLGMMLIRGTGVAANVSDGYEMVRQAADHGSVNAMVNLGSMREEGSGGVSKDDREAFVWYARAGEAGSAIGMYHLGSLYKSGTGTSRSAADAVRWFSAAADAGHPLAAYSAAMVYELGLGVAQNHDLAIGFFQRAIGPLQRAVDRGDSVAALYDLGRCYAEGWGTERNFTLAVDCFVKAANRGDAKAAARLSWMYGSGQGVTRDDSEAAKWYRKAHDLGYTDSSDPASP